MYRLYNLTKYTAPIAMMTLPLLVLAQEDLISNFTNVVERLIPLLFLIAGVVFIFGIVRYVTAGADEEKMKQGRNLMIFGIIALAVMLGVWGLVTFLLTTFGLDASQGPPPSWIDD
ncbi:pilin [Patescibacteria group bacterium]